MQPSDIALGLGAESFYGVSPGQTFVDTRGNTVRFADQSGSGNPMNEDVFRLAKGGIVSKRILSWIGEAGKEAVIPLTGNRGRNALAGALGGSGPTHNVTINVSVSGIATSEVAAELADNLRNKLVSIWMTHGGAGQGYEP